MKELWENVCLGLFDREEVLEILEQIPYCCLQLKDASPWACFLCSPYQLETHGLLVPRQDWQEEVLRLFNPRSQENPHMVMHL